MTSINNLAIENETIKNSLLAVAKLQAELYERFDKSVAIKFGPAFDAVERSFGPMNAIFDNVVTKFSPFLGALTELSKQWQPVFENVAPIIENMRALVESRKLKELLENHDFLVNIEHFNPGLYSALVKGFEDKSYSELVQFISECRKLPQDKQYDFICNHINYFPDISGEIQQIINTVQSKEFNSDLGDIVNNISINDQAETNKNVNELCIKHNLSSNPQININFYVNVNKPNKTSFFEEVKKQIIVSLIVEAFLKGLPFIYCLIKASLILQEPLTGEITAEQIHQMQLQEEKQQQSPIQMQSQNNNIEISLPETMKNSQSQEPKL